MRRLNGTNTEELEGAYYTNRKTIGDLKLVTKS